MTIAIAISLGGTVLYLLLFAFSLGRRRKASRLFSAYVLVMGIWAFTSLMWHWDHPVVGTLPWLQVGMVFVILAWNLMWSLSMAVLGFSYRPLKRRTFMVLHATSAVLVMAAIAGKLLTVTRVTRAHYLVEFGSLMFLFMPLVGLSGVVLFILFAREISRARESEERNRLLYFASACMLLVLGGLANVSTELRPYPVDVAAGGVAAALMAYAIQRYHLLDLSIVLRTGLSYTVLGTIIAAPYLIVIFVVERLVRSALGFGAYVIPILAAILMAAALQPLQARAQAWIDRLFFRQKYDLGQMLRRVSQRAVSILDPDALGEMLLQEVTATMQVSRACILLRERETGDFCVQSEIGFEAQAAGFSLRSDDCLPRWLSRERRVLTQRQMDVLPQFKALWTDKREAIGSLGEVFVPLLAKEDLVGVLACGPKLSEESYSPDDMDALSALASQTAIASQNAWLHQEVLEEKEMAETLVQESFAGVMMVDGEMRVTVLNHAAETITGISAGEMLGRRLSDVLGPEVWGEDSPLQKAMVEGERAEPVAATWTAQAGTRDVLHGVTPVPGGYMLSFDDITQLKEADRLKSNIVANVSHELRSPLASIKAFTELLQDNLDGDDPKLRKRFLSLIEQETDRLTQLINDLLDLSRLEAGRFKVNRVPLSVSELVDDASGMLEVQADKQDVHLHVDIPKGLPVIHADQELLSLVAKNLIGNAIKFSPNGGQVDVVARQRGDDVVLEVCDQGMGISAEELPQLFIKFHRGARAMEAGIQGTGLGLALVKEAAEAHGGSVQVTSEEGVGSRFSVILPIGEIPGANDDVVAGMDAEDTSDEEGLFVAQAAEPLAAL